MLNEFYRVAFRKKLYGSIEELLADLDDWNQRLQRDQASSGQVVLWENAHVDLP